jgi:glyoxalase family protein
VEGGTEPPAVIDRFCFKSIYFREPGGVLFKSATDGLGFGVDEDLATLGESPLLSSLPNTSKTILCPLLPADHPA